MGLRQRKRDRTEASIVRTAHALFQEHGYDETTVEAIAAGSDVSPRTFYRYFESKDMTLAIVGFRSVDRALDGLDPDVSIGELVRCLADATERILTDDSAQVAVRLTLEHPAVRSKLPAWRARWASHLADGLAAAAARDQPDSADRLRAEVGITIIGIAVEEWIRSGGKAKLTDVANQGLWDLQAGLRRPLRSHPGR